MIDLIKQTKIQIAVIVVLTVLAYSNSLSNGLVWDDHLFLESWPDIQSFQGLENVLKGSAPPSQDKIFRPVRGLIYIIDYSIWGKEAFGYHLQALFIHLATTVLVYLIARGIVGSYWLVVHSKNGKSINHELQAKRTINYLPFMAGLLFGLHPIHTETINYISASMETWGSLLFFISFYLYILDKKKEPLVHFSKWFYPASILFAFLAFFTYEMTLTLPLLIVLYDLVLGTRYEALGTRIKNRFIFWLPYFFGLVVFLAVRTAVLGLISRTEYLGYSFYLTQLVMVKVFVRYILLLFFPFNQSVIHNLVGDFPSSMIPYDSLDPILNQNIFDAYILISIVIIIGLLIYSIKYIKTQSLISFCILWFFISLLPVSYIIPHGGAMAEKYLYIASFGFCLLLSYLFIVMLNLVQHLKIGFRNPSASLRADKFGMTIGIVFISCILLTYFSLTYTRNPVWKDDISLFSDVVKKSPGNLMANYTLGIWYGRTNQFDKAEEHYKIALEKAPQFAEARFNLGNLYLRGGHFDEATEEYNTLVNSYPNFIEAKNTLANISYLRESTKSAVFGESVMVNYENKNGFEFLFPVQWSLVKEEDKDTLKDPNGILKIELESAVNNQDLTIEEYIKEQKQVYGKLINQGKAFIPGWDGAFVRVWDPVPAGTGQRQILEFYLFKDKKVIKVLVNPLVPELMGDFDRILGSIKIKDAVGTRD